MVARVLRRGATRFCMVVAVATCVNLRASTDENTPRLPPVVVSRPGDSNSSVPLDMRPMLASDSAYFRAHPLMVPVEGVMPSQLTDTFHEARSGGGSPMGARPLAVPGPPR